MADPAVTIFEIVHEHIGRKNKIEWKSVQAIINKRVKENKGVDQKTIKQQVFNELAGCIKRAMSHAMTEFYAQLNDELVTAWLGDVQAVLIDVRNNNPDIEAIASEYLNDSLGGLEHNLNEKQWKMVDEVRRLLSHCIRIGIRTGKAEAAEALRKAIAPLLPSPWRTDEV